MGSGSSTAARHKDLGKSQHAIVQLMMPIYFDSLDCTLAEHKMAEDCWNLVLSDKAPVYLARIGTKGFQYTSCVTFFYDNFYVRLFDVHPASKELFKSGMRGQGKFLVMMLTLALSELANPSQFDKSLLKLADIHYKRGVKAVEFGDVLFWTLRKVMGEAYYTVELHKAWVKIYSRMLKTLVPAGVSHEMHGDESCTMKRDMTSMFTNGAMSCAHAGVCGSTDDKSLSNRLDSQKMLDEHNQASVQLRPASKV